MHNGAVVGLVLVAALSLSTQFWPTYVTIHSPGQYIIEFPIQIARVAISAVLPYVSAYVILAPAYGLTDRHWAYGMIGAIVGFSGTTTCSKGLVGYSKQFPASLSTLL